MRAMRSAAALLRGAAGLALVSQRTATAGAGALAAAELARCLDQGWAVRHAATAAGGDESGRGPPRKRSPRVGVLNEKTAEGKPKPDERTVADLVRRSWFKSEVAAVALLTRKKTGHNRYPFETAEPAADWLEATLGPEPVKAGLCPAAKAVTVNPRLLLQNAATLQCKWDALTLPAERGGVGIELSTEQAREAARSFPQLLGFSVEKYKACWSMLLSTEGLDQTPEEARECIVRDPQILLNDHSKVVRRVKLLESLGYAQARTMVLTNSRMLCNKEETVKEHDAWWKHTGLDHVKIVTALPTLLGSSSTKELQVKLNFLRDIAKLSDADLNCGGPFFSAKLDKLRSRFFYALKHGALERYKLSTLTFCSDARFLRFVHQLDALADASTIAEYEQEVATAAFQAWAAAEEAQRLRGTA